MTGLKLIYVDEKGPRGHVVCGVRLNQERAMQCVWLVIHEAL